MNRVLQKGWFNAHILKSICSRISEEHNERKPITIRILGGTKIKFLKVSKLSVQKFKN